MNSNETKNIRHCELHLELDGKRHVEEFYIPTALLRGLTGKQVTDLLDSAAKDRVKWLIAERL